MTLGMRTGTSLIAILLLSAVACGEGDTLSGEGGGGGDEIIPISLSGDVVDFETGEVLESATVSVDGISPPPTVSVTGGAFEVVGIPPFSTFHLLAGSAPAYRSTYSVAIESEDADLSGVTVESLSEDYVDALYSAFGVEPSTSTSLVVGRLVDEAGEAVAGVAGADIKLDPAFEGPFFLDADKQPDPQLSESSSSGYVVVFNVSPGVVHFEANAGADLSLLMAESPVAARAATLAEILVSDGEVVVPTGVSFSQHVSPIFERRGCTLCHSGSGIGKDLGGLHLNGESQKMYKELAEEISGRHGTLRVNLEVPEESLLLTMPSKEDPPDVHPNSTFVSPADPDYLILLGWIQEGALNN